MHKKKKGIKKRIAEYEKQQGSFFKYLSDEYLIEDGSAVIMLDLSETEVYDPISMGVQRELNGDIYDFIDSKVYPVPTAIPVRLEIYGVPENERARVQSIIREHYDVSLRDKKLDLRINRIKSTSLFVLGGMMLGLYFVLANIISSEVWYEILSIIATFTVWEAADCSILARRELKSEYYYTAQMVLAEIIFK